MPTSKPIIPGDRFGRLTALEITETRTFPSGTSVHFRQCRCDCGIVTMASETKLRSGNRRSCGCLLSDVTAERNMTHGHAAGRNKRDRIYNVWASMLARCTNPKSHAYHNYGGRGISVCDRWMKFENFLQDMGAPPPGLTIDRINNDGNYCKENCAWKTRLDQARNRRPRRKAIT